MLDALSRLYRTKTLLSCVLLVATGVGLMLLESAITRRPSLHWLQPVPLQELGGILIGGGVLSVWLDQFLSREQDEIDEQRLRRLLHEQAPAMRDAVLDAFAANSEDLARVATPETLDQIIANSLAMRLGDDQFATEIYDDIRAQAVGASERWYDASLSIDLTPATNARAGQHFLVTVRWEYTVMPRHAQRRFVCLSDRDEYAELVSERGPTSAWYLKPASGIDAGTPAAFELLRFTVNGENRPIRRAQRKNGQLYTASVGTDHVAAGQPVVISYTYRTVTSRAGHLLFFDIEQPTRDLRVDFDYGGCGIASVSALDLVPSVRRARIERPSDTTRSILRVDIDGWVFPRSGVAFVWTLDAEIKAKRSTTLKHREERAPS